MRTPEGIVKDLLRKYLKEHGAYAHWPVPRGLGKRTVDALVCLAGRFVAYECKAYGEHPTALQEKELSDIMAAGGLAVIATVDADGNLILYPFKPRKLEKVVKLAIL